MGFVVSSVDFFNAVMQDAMEALAVGDVNFVKFVDK